MSYLPCKNQNCNSYGKPHPNCKCYPGMADGGDVSFCSSRRQHKSDCEYYAEGGDVVPDSEVTVEANSPEIPDSSNVSNNSNSSIVPDSEVTPDQPDLGEVVPDDDVIPGKTLEEYSTPAQQFLAAHEAGAQGVLGPVATAAELGLSKLGVPGISAEDQAARKEANPWIHAGFEGAGVAGSMLAGVGEAALAMKGAEAAAKMANLGRIGSSSLMGAVTNGLVQGGDEISKALLGQGDPEAPVASALVNTSLATLFGGLLGGAGAGVAKGASSGLRNIADSKIGTKAGEWLAGFGQAASKGGLDSESSKIFASGHKAYQQVTNGIAAGIGSKAGIAMPIAGPYSVIIGKEAGEKFLGPLIRKVAGSESKYAVPSIIKWLSGGAEGSLSGLLEYANNVGRGATAINKGVDGLFKAGSQQAVNHASNKDVENLREYISNGGINQNIKEALYDEETPAYAEGGLVKKPKLSLEPKPSVLKDNDPVAMHFPAQNMMLQAAKGRVSNYLSSIQPQKNQPKLVFDDEPDDREAKKSYDKALHVAIKPLSVLEHIKAGTIEPDQIKHLNSMYPEITSHLQKKITERITQDQVDGKKPSYKVRQGLSMLMGTALSGEFTPAGIQAAQSVFAPKQASPQGGSKKEASGLDKASKSYLTSDQARQARQSKV